MVDNEVIYEAWYCFARDCQPGTRAAVVFVLPVQTLKELEDILMVSGVDANTIILYSLSKRLDIWFVQVLEFDNHYGLLLSQSISFLNIFNTLNLDNRECY